MLPLIIGLGVSVPAVLTDYIMDDLMFQHPAYQPDVLKGYYNYIDEMRRLEILPWWSSDTLRIDFFRPLSSASLYLDFHLGHKRPWVGHLHTALLFIAMLIGSALFLRRLLRDPKHQKWAFTIFALGNYHAMLVGFVATRHALMANTFAIYAAWAFLLWRQKGRQKWLGTALLLFVFGLLSGESALSFAGFAVAYALILSEGHLKTRLKRCLPVGVVTAIYLIAYIGMGFGVEGSGMYISPLSHPIDYISAAPGKLLALIGAFTLGVPAQIRISEGFEPAVVRIGAVSLCLLLITVLLAWKHVWEEDRRMVKGALLMGLLAVLPGLSGYVCGHVETLAGLALSIVMAVVLSAIRFGSLSKRRKWVAWPLAGIIAFFLLVMAPLSRFVQSQFMIGTGAQYGAALANRPLPCAKDAAVYLVNGDFLSCYYFPFLLLKSEDRLRNNWHQLVVTTSDVTVYRTGPDALTISHEDRPLLAPADFSLFADPKVALPQGTIVETDGLTARVEKRTDKGPTRLTFQIPALGDTGKVCLLKLNQFRLERFPIPEIGNSTVLPYLPPMPGQ